MEYTIEEYISKNKIINILLSYCRESNISINEIYFYYLTPKNSYIFQKIILSGKFISVEIHFCALGSYNNIDILSYANEISVYRDIPSENIIDIIHYSINLQKLTLQSSCISSINVKKKLSEKKFLKYIKIMLSEDVNTDDIYELMQIKSLDTLYFLEYYNNRLSFQNIFKILCYIFNNLNKNIKIVFHCYEQDYKFIKFINLIAYNFEINNNNYIFTYITCAFRKFYGLYDFNLYYL